MKVIHLVYKDVSCQLYLKRKPFFCQIEAELIHVNGDQSQK